MIYRRLGGYDIIFGYQTLKFCHHRISCRTLLYSPGNEALVENMAFFVTPVAKHFPPSVGSPWEMAMKLPSPIQQTLPNEQHSQLSRTTISEETLVPWLISLKFVSKNIIYLMVWISNLGFILKGGKDKIAGICLRESFQNETCTYESPTFLEWKNKMADFLKNVWASFFGAV